MSDTNDEPMTPAELRVIREFLGLPGDWLAHHIGVQDRTWRRWEAGTSPIPHGARIEIERIEQTTAATVTDAIEQLRDARDAEIITYRTDQDYHDAHPEQPWPASYHRAIVARVAQEVPGLVIRY